MMTEDDAPTGRLRHREKQADKFETKVSKRYIKTE
jgi:hypothetical protein